MRDLVTFLAGTAAGLSAAALQDADARRRLSERLQTMIGRVDTTHTTALDPFLREAVRAVRLGAEELVALAVHVRAEIAAPADVVETTEAPHTPTSSGDAEGRDASAVTVAMGDAQAQAATPGASDPG